MYGGHSEISEGSILQLHIQSDWTQMKLPAQSPHGLKHKANCCYCLLTESFACRSQILWQQKHKGAAACYTFARQ